MQITSSSLSHSAFILRYQDQAKAVSEISPTTNASGQNQTDKTDAQQQQREIQALKDRDREVRSHEQAHLSAAGGIAVSGANFQFVTGPDGQRYATGGEVGIDISAVPGDPEATMRKAETIRRAAMAPAQPSAQDFSVASKAAAMANKAGIELLRGQQEANRSGFQLDVRA
ncbi:hypothetical protein IVG45_08600 [Methylomonas sp. LL1]|uniref:putative metalloprotease CJM1_0395 family protein n=1 Tax=Methylomonas sp. LL1 TaxID=2785785 RepID=UPI0018C35F73|nr:putative metalloprotease CJM1_0395 family protein [Methylomonas sp. LL1]QPK64982.1 hypothetical protein IVG45_08600 [Methylomonas sp. LL1]